MQRWTIKNYHPVAKRSVASVNTTQAHLIPSAFTQKLLLSAVILTCQSQLFADTFPMPYQAVYSTSFSGISAKMNQSLEQTAPGQWQLQNHVSIAFVGFSEEAIFSTEGRVMTPQRYQYKNAMSTKRSSDLSFNNEQRTVVDSLHSIEPLPLREGALDKLSFQAQLRADLIGADGDFTEKTYALVDRTKYKIYTVKKLSDVILETPLGTFDAVKLEQRRAGKDRYTLIWTAKDLDHMILRIQRIDGDGDGPEVNLQSLIISGTKISDK